MCDHHPVLFPVCSADPTNPACRIQSGQVVSAAQQQEVLPPPQPGLTYVLDLFSKPVLMCHRAQNLFYWTINLWQSCRCWLPSLFGSGNIPNLGKQIKNLWGFWKNWTQKIKFVVVSRLLHLFPLVKWTLLCRKTDIKAVLSPYNKKSSFGQTSPVFMCLFCCFSPGRSPISFDHEIVMMNHVYKERFPKVCTADTQKAFTVMELMCVCVWRTTHGNKSQVSSKGCRIRFSTPVRSDEPPGDSLLKSVFIRARLIVDI